jgi:hypothetical protein
MDKVIDIPTKTGAEKKYHQTYKLEHKKNSFFAAVLFGFVFVSVFFG